MSTPSIKVGQGNWGIKAGNLLGYANTDKKYVARDFTVGRLLDTATRVNASGNIEIVNANIPRIDYFGGQASLLVELSSANSMLYSQAINSWTTKTELTITDNYAVSPGGTQNASYIQQTTGGNVVNLQSAGVNLTSGQAQSVTFYAKAAQVTSVTLRFGTAALWAGSVRPQFTFDLINGSITMNAGTATVSSQSVGNGWHRYSIVTPATIASGQTSIQTVTNTVFSPNSGDGFYLWGVQWEQNISTPTSYIPTTTGTVTRNNDNISLTGVSGLIGQTEGTIYAEAAYSNIDVVKTFASITDGTTNNRIALRINSTASIAATIVVAGSANSITQSIPAIPSSGVLKIALGYKANDYALAINGTIYHFTTTRPVPPTTSVFLGNNGFNSDYLNDRIRAVSIYQTRLPNTTTDGSPSLQSITTL